MEEKQISTGLKYTFIVHAIVGVIVGLGFLLIPQTIGEWTGLPIAADLSYRMVGAAILGFAVSSFLCYQEPIWGKVKIVVLMEIVWTVLGALVVLYYLLLADPKLEPAGWGWVVAVVLAAFAVAFGYFYFSERG